MMCLRRSIAWVYTVIKFAREEVLIAWVHAGGDALPCGSAAQQEHSGTAGRRSHDRRHLHSCATHGGSVLCSMLPHPAL